MAGDDFARDVDRHALAAQLADLAVLVPTAGDVLRDAADELARGFPVSAQWEADIVRIVYEGFEARRRVGTAECVIERVRLLLHERRKR
jgi:hypothetical protein